MASFAGVDRHPAWYLNLVSDPHVATEVRGKLARGVARVLDVDGAAEVWPYLDRSCPGLRRYRKRTSRQIPIVEVIREQAGAASASAAPTG